jgi:hypothetical protein
MSCGVFVAQYLKKLLNFELDLTLDLKTHEDIIACRLEMFEDLKEHANKNSNDIIID